MSLADEMICLRRIATGNGAHEWSGHTQQELTAMTHDDVLGWRTELEAIDALLERLESAGRAD